MQENLNQTEPKGRTFFLGLVLLFLSSTFLLGYLELQAANPDLKTIFGLDIFLGTFFFLMYLGLPWAKWVLSVMLIINGLNYLILGFDDENTGYKVVAIAFLYIGLIVHFSKLLKAFFLGQRQVTPTPNTEPNPEEALPTDLNTEALPLSKVEVTDAYAYPTLLRRVQTSFIDGMLVIFFWVLFFSWAETIGGLALPLKLLVLALGLSYEPLMTSLSATLGQRLMGIRVRQHVSRSEAVSLPKAYLRLMMKVALGWLSYLTIHSNTERRAIHDMAVGSVMLDVRAMQPQVV
jgi:hypothetical protein